MNHWMFRCQDVSQKVSQSMDARLPLLQRMAIRIHLTMCRYCARVHRQLTLLRTMSRLEDRDHATEGDHERLSEIAKTRIKSKLRSAI